MGSAYYGDVDIGNNNEPFSQNSSLSSRRKKKSNNSPKMPKQPQRGLGVAQLEKIRLHGQMGCTTYYPSNNPYTSHHNLNYTQEAYGSVPPSGSSYGYHQPNMMMGYSEMERPNMGWINDSTGFAYESHQVHYSQSDYMSRSYISSQDHDEAGSSDQEMDLELRL